MLDLLVRQHHCQNNVFINILLTTYLFFHWNHFLFKSGDVNNYCDYYVHFWFILLKLIKQNEHVMSFSKFCTVNWFQIIVTVLQTWSNSKTKSPRGHWHRQSGEVKEKTAHWMSTTIHATPRFTPSPMCFEHEPAPHTARLASWTWPQLFVQRMGCLDPIYR